MEKKMDDKTALTFFTQSPSSSKGLEFKGLGIDQIRV